MRYTIAEVAIAPITTTGNGNFAVRAIMATVIPAKR